MTSNRIIQRELILEGLALFIYKIINSGVYLSAFYNVLELYIGETPVEVMPVDDKG